MRADAGPAVLALVKYPAPAFVYPINNCDLMMGQLVPVRAVVGQLSEEAAPATRTGLWCRLRPKINSSLVRSRFGDLLIVSRRETSC